jgi:hypothetical protein
MGHIRVLLFKNTAKRLNVVISSQLNLPNKTTFKYAKNISSTHLCRSEALYGSTHDLHRAT